MPASARRAFRPSKLLENTAPSSTRSVKAKPTGAKGTYVQKVALSSTMGPGVRVDVAQRWRPELAKRRLAARGVARRRAGGARMPPNLSETARGSFGSS